MAHRFRWLTALLVVAGLAAPAPTAAVGGFGDVDADRYYTEAVQWMVDEGITTGTAPSCFDPDGRVTRGQLAAFLHRMAGEPEVVASAPFTDVVENWQVDAVAWMFAEGITTGITATTFGPDEPVSRGQVAALLHRRAGLPEAEPHGFTDVLAPWQTEAVSWLFAEGITTGTSETTFSPDLPLNRAQIATFLHRAAGAPPVEVDPTAPYCDAGSARRDVVTTGHGVLGHTDGVEIRFPADAVELVGYHESGHDGAQQLEPAVHDVPSLTMETRDRGTGSRTATDIVVAPDEVILSPVTGTVIRAGGYRLYCDYRDEFVVIQPTGRPGWEVKVFHFDGLAVAVGDPVVAGETRIGAHAAILPFVSQIDEFTASPSWPHVHVEVIDTSIPDRPSGRGC